MSLDWNAKNAPNWDKIPDFETKKSLVFSCMSVGIGEITEANHEEWYTRYLQIYQAYNWGDPYLTLEDVRNGIGLTTNVFPKETPAAFRKKLVRIIEEKAGEKFRAAKKEQEASND